MLAIASWDWFLPVNALAQRNENVRQGWKLYVEIVLDIIVLSVVQFNLPSVETRWQEPGLYLFHLPKYSSQLNPVESLWRDFQNL